MILVQSAVVPTAPPLTVSKIKIALGDLDKVAATANNCFNFKYFIENASNALTSVRRVNAIKFLRKLLNTTNFTNNVIFFLNNTEFLNNRLLQLEIEHSNLGPPIQNLRVAALERMMVLLDSTVGTASGILVPIPKGVGQPHSWGVLTCGHVLQDIPLCDDGKNYAFKAQLNIPGFPLLPVHSIKFFKRASVRTQNSNPTSGGYENFPDNTVNAQDIRAIPRYEDPADLALCELGLAPAQIAAINASILTPISNNGSYPFIQIGTDHTISFDGIGGFRYRFHLVQPVQPGVLVGGLSVRNNLVASINGVNKVDNFILGYPAYTGVPRTLTLSNARSTATQLYAGFIDPPQAATLQQEFMFFHDAPTYSGMSGGPIFNTPAANNEINIYGVVQGYDSPDPDDDATHEALQSRCAGSFIIESLFN